MALRKLYLDILCDEVTSIRTFYWTSGGQVTSRTTLMSNVSGMMMAEAVSGASDRKKMAESGDQSGTKCVNRINTDDKSVVMSIIS